MLEEISLQKDDYDLLGLPMFPLSSCKYDYEWKDEDYLLFVNKYKNLVNFTMERFLNKDNEMFQMIWRTNGDVPDRTNAFYQHFPKVSTNYESDHHVASFINVNHFYLGRWLPKQILTFLFPFEEIVTSSKKLNSKSVPTINECRLCERFKGVGVWNRSGEWFCLRDENSLTLDQVNAHIEKLRNSSHTIKNEAPQQQSQSSDANIRQDQAKSPVITKNPLPNIESEKLNLSKEDELGPLYFKSYNDLKKWNKSSYEPKVYELENRLLHTQSAEEYSVIEKELRAIRALKKSGSFNSNLIVTVKG